MSFQFTQEDSDQLTQTGPGTPMGDLMRRYWFPAMLSERLPEPHCDPIPIKLLGEELVAFRGADGRVGLMDRYCPHRGTSLVLARNEDCALRCIYHAWKIDVDGNVLETPPEKPGGTFADSIKHQAYKTHEVNGMIWTYMGPADEVPPFPRWPFTLTPESHTWSVHLHQPSNWVRALDGDFDAAHAGYLHYSRVERDRQINNPYDGGKFLFDPRPGTAVEEAPWGLQVIFRLGLENPADSTFWVRAFVSPMFSMTGQSDGVRGLFHAYVPIDDYSHYVYTVVWRDDAPLTPEQVTVINDTLQYTMIDPDNAYFSKDWNGEGYVQDREQMDSRETYSGFEGIFLQDIAVQHSMGPTVDFAKENLGAEDYLVIKVRRYLLDMLDNFAAGKEPLPGLAPEMDHNVIERRWVLAPTDTPMKEILDRKDWVSKPGEIPADWKPALDPWTSLPD